MSSDNPEDLNYDCNYNMYIAKTQLTNLPALQDQQLAVKWMKKLALSNKSIAEMKIRNDFMYYLVLNIQAGKLENPFTDVPPADDILDYAHLLPHYEERAEAGADNKDSFLYANSPDGGAFLAAQPIPRCGAFCYLAVVSRSNK